MNGRLLTPDEVAIRYGISRWTVYERTRTNQLPLIQHPGCNRVHIPDRWLEAYDLGDVDLVVTETRNRHGKGRIVRPRGVGDGGAL